MNRFKRAKVIVIGHIVCLLILTQGCMKPKGGNSTLHVPSELSEAYPLIDQAENIRSFLVSRNGDLIFEEYYMGYSSDSLDHVRSVTKSVMSLLIGIAIDHGFINSTDDSIGLYLGNKAEGKGQLTLKHFLTMTSGLAWDEGENASGYNRWVTSSNQLKVALSKSVANEPRTVWNYNSGGIHVLSAILTEATGMDTRQFAKKYLFDPLAIETYRWEKLSDGYYNGAAGLELKPKDMIKIGQLIVNGGTFKGQRVISENYLKVATQHHQPINMNLEEGNGYGYCWWLAAPEGNQVVLAMGYAGQLITIIPEYETVIVLTHHWRVNGDQAWKQDRFATNTLLAKVLEGLTKEPQ